MTFAHALITFGVATFAVGWIMYRILSAAKKEPPSPPEKENDENL